MAPQAEAKGDDPAAAPLANYEDMDPAEKRLRELGYKQELKRELSLISIVGVSSSLLNPFITVVPFYAVALSFGGPMALMWPWWPTFFFVVCCGLCLSEICSSFPTAGSVYYWSCAMCPPSWRSLVGWMTAWMEVLALVAGNASVAFPAAQIIQQIIFLMSGGANGGGYFASKGVFFAIYAGLIWSWNLLNAFGVNYVSTFLASYVYYQFALIVAICIVLPVVAPTTKSAEYVFTTWETSSEVTGVNGNVANWLYASLLPMFSTFGFDLAAQVTEETKNAERTGPIALMSAIIAEIIFGFTLITVFTFCIQGEWYDLFSSDSATGGLYPVAQIIYDVFHTQYGNGTGAYILLMLMVVPFFASGSAGALGASRAIYAFSREGIMPFSNVFKRVTKTTKVPIYATWAVATIASIMGLPNFGSTVAFNAIASTATIAWVGSYFAPIYFRITMDDKRFKRGPFHIGPFIRPVGVLALGYIVFTCGMFSLPLFYPVTKETFNYAPLTWFAIMTIAFLYWLIDGRKWFTGPKIEEMAANDVDMH